MTRTSVAAVRMCCERHLLATARRPAPRQVGRILCYHTVGQREWGVNDVSPERFRKHLELALTAGFRFVPASELARTGGGPKDLAITFDDGMKSVGSTAAPILKEYGIPWSLFVVSSWADHQTDWGRELVLGWRDVERLASHGAEIGSHSLTHPDFGKLEYSRTVDELGASRRAVEDHLGLQVSSFAIPYGQSMNWPALAAAAAREIGYETVYAQAEDTRPSGTIPRTFVTGFDGDRIFRSLLRGSFDRWEEWL